MRVGQWIEKRFPEKITAEDVAKSFVAIQAKLDEHSSLFSLLDADRTIFYKGLADFNKLKEDYDLLKTQLTFKLRPSPTSSDPAALTRSSMFATKLPPVQPAPASNGGNKSPQ